MTSPPRDVERADQTSTFTRSRMNRAEPSPSSTFAPPGCSAKNWPSAPGRVRRVDDRRHLAGERAAVGVHLGARHGRTPRTRSAAGGR